MFPGVLVPIGGHIEQEEISDPKRACLREIREETGLIDEDLIEFTQRYIILRLKQNREIRIHYIYFGTVREGSKLVSINEGQFAWVTLETVLEENITDTTKEVIKHYMDKGNETNQVYVGSMKSLNGEPHTTWALLKEWQLGNIFQC